MFPAESPLASLLFISAGFIKARDSEAVAPMKNVTASTPAREKHKRERNIKEGFCPLPVCAVFLPAYRWLPRILLNVLCLYPLCRYGP